MTTGISFQALGAEGLTGMGNRQTPRQVALLGLVWAVLAQTATSGEGLLSDEEIEPPKQEQKTVKKPPDRKPEYIERVTRGEGFMPWQEQASVSAGEKAFREKIEKRKDEMLAARAKVKHPAMLTEEEIEQARQNIEQADWARGWFEKQKEIADHIVSQPHGYIEKMLPELTPTHGYGFTCPDCLGRLSQEGGGYRAFGWDYKEPDVVRCKKCGYAYPSDKYPETAELVAPRHGQTFTYYLNARERKHPDDRSGRWAWRWVGRPMHMSFTGIVRERKAGFAIGAMKTLALVYRLTGDSRYAEKAVAMLVRYAHCYRNWLYHDYWDSIADCDPMYAAWHGNSLKLEWKRHLCGSAFSRDSSQRARMLQSYWGAGRIHPSTDYVTCLDRACLAYDLVYDARDSKGAPLWTPEKRAKVERDLILEWLIGAEPFVGGAGKAGNTNNKAPRVYMAMAAAAKCLGITQYADLALRGYEGIRDRSFLFDGFSRESPAYTNMYLGTLLHVPETLHGFRWPKGFAKRSGVVDLFQTDSKLRLMLRSVVDQLRPDGRYCPLSDTCEANRHSQHVIEIGLKRYPEYFAGKLPRMAGENVPSEYAVLKLDAEAVGKDAGLNLSDIYYPAWMTAFLRHGRDPEGSAVALPFNPPGGHRHRDNLALYYVDRGRTILGDHGYVCDTPLNGWIHATASHNLVLVDGAEQSNSKRPKLHLMAVSPRLSVVEASSNAYGNCSDYRRLLALVKGPNSQTFLIDIFRVKGGRTHDYRVFSELASSDAGKKGALEFPNLGMPEEKPLPDVGASYSRAAIYGLRDARQVKNPPGSWQAIWKEPGRQYRLWMLSPVDTVQASNGPGQETVDQVGRRVRYLDAVHRGNELKSVFVAVHEPSGTDGEMPIIKAERLTPPKEAGPDARALRIDSKWGTYLVFHNFETEAEVAGARFRGAFGALCTQPDGKRWLFAVGANTLGQGDFGFSGKTPRWSGKIASRSGYALTADSTPPEDWPARYEGCHQYVVVRGRGLLQTGFPVKSINGNKVAIERFPIRSGESFGVPALQYIQEQKKATP